MKWALVLLASCSHAYVSGLGLPRRAARAPLAPRRAAADALAAWAPPAEPDDLDARRLAAAAPIAVGAATAAMGLAYAAALRALVALVWSALPAALGDRAGAQAS